MKYRSNPRYVLLIHPFSSLLFNCYQFPLSRMFTQSVLHLALLCGGFSGMQKPAFTVSTAISVLLSRDPRRWRLGETSCYRVGEARERGAAYERAAGIFSFTGMWTVLFVRNFKRAIEQYGKISVQAVEENISRSVLIAIVRL